MSSGDHIDVEAVTRRAAAALNRLTKWRTVFAGWQLGTRPSDDGETRAVRDHRELTILLRAEISTLTGLLEAKGVFTRVEFTEALAEEAEKLSADYSRRFDGMEATDDGIAMDVARAQATMKRLGFPP